MESVISLRFSTLPSPSVRMASGFHAARATKPHLRLSHSSLSLAKDPTSRSLGHSSSLSLPKTSGGRPLGHTIGPISCLVHGSLPSSDWGSGFRWNIGSGNRSNHKANMNPPEGSSQSTNDKERQFIYIAKELKQSPLYDLAVKLLKASEPIVEEKDAGISNKNIHDQIMDKVKKQNDSRDYDLGVELLMILEQSAKDPDSRATIKLEIIKILYSQGKYQEAFKHWTQLCKMEQTPPQIIKLAELFDMKPDSLIELMKVVECLTELKIPGKEIPANLLRSIDDLKKINILELMNNGEGFPFGAPPDSS